MTHGVRTTGRRTTIRAGREAEYERIHAQVPPAVHASLLGAGVLRWHIWRDGRLLFHTIDTTDGYEAMLAAITALPPVDPAWDLVIADLLEAEAGADVMLPAVWWMDGAGQHAGDGGTDSVPTAPHRTSPEASSADQSAGGSAAR